MSKRGYYSYATVTAATAIMATPSKIQLDVMQKPAFAIPRLSEESARKASELLQKNHEEHHIFFNNEGFHVSGLFAKDHARTQTDTSDRIT